MMKVLAMDVVQLHNNVNVFSATELYTYRTIKWVNFYAIIFYHDEKSTVLELIIISYAASASFRKR